jgi:hypothetical protein
VITTTPKSKAKIKPSHQTLFVPEAMEVAGKKEDERWDAMQGRIDLLFVKLETQGDTQQQMFTQLGLTTQALARTSSEQLALVQQITATTDLVAKLAAERAEEHEAPPVNRVVDPDPHFRRVVAPESRRGGGRNRHRDEVQLNRSSLPKLSFSKV